MADPSDHGDGDDDLEATIIVPVRNQAASIIRQIEALRAQMDRRHECIVVDDASTDGTGERVGEWITSTGDARFRLIRRSERGGPNASRNSGLVVARGSTIVFTDGDDLVLDGWLAALVAASGPGRIVGGPLGWPRRADGSRPEPEGIDGLPRWNGWTFAYGCNFTVDRHDALVLGGFDENILAGATEVEFAIRAADAGVASFHLAPEAVVEYRRPASARGDLAKAFARERGYAYVARRHGVADRGWKTGIVQLGRGARLVARGELGAGRALLARATGRLLGGVWFRFRFRFDLPAPALLGSASEAPAEAARGPLISSSPAGPEPSSSDRRGRPR